MKIECCDDNEIETEKKKWKTTVERLNKTNTGFETSITAGSWLFHIVVSH